MRSVVELAEREILNPDGKGKNMGEKDCREVPVERQNVCDGSMFGCPKCQMELCISTTLTNMYSTMVRRTDESRNRVGQKGFDFEPSRVRFGFQMDRQGRRMQNAKGARCFASVRNGLKISWAEQGERKGKGN